MAEKDKDEGGDGWLGKIGLILGIVAGVPAALIAAYQLYQVATGKETFASLLNQAQTVVVQGGGAVVAPANCSEPGEKTSWDKARTDRSRTAYAAYLASYQNCPNAQRARDILATSCKMETTETWKSSPMFQSNQAVRGVGSIPDSGSTIAAACSAAKKMANAQAKTNCEAIANGGGYRNPQWKVNDQDCACNKASDTVTVCVADLSASCSWEAKIPEQTEVCG
jgi:hypothetical protein